MKVNVIKVSFFRRVQNSYDEIYFVVSTKYDMWEKLELYLNKFDSKVISNIETQYFGEFNDGDDSYEGACYGRDRLQEQTGIEQLKFWEFGFESFRNN